MPATTVPGILAIRNEGTARRDNWITLTVSPGDTETPAAREHAFFTETGQRVLAGKIALTTPATVPEEERP